MKRKLIFSFLLLSFVLAKASTTGIFIDRDPTGKDPVPLSVTLSEFPVSATVNETELAIYFDYSVGNATITVYDDANNIVHQEIVNTDSTTEVYIDNTSWSSGDYIVKISYGTTHLIGYFQIP